MIEFDADALKHQDEAKAVAALLAANRLNTGDRAGIVGKAIEVVQASRAQRDQQGTLDAFLGEFGLSNAEGVTLMCLAEALLRIPDAETRDDLIAERIHAGDWKKHLGASERGFVNAGVWALMLTGRLIEVPDPARRDPDAWLKHLISRSSEPVVRAAIGQAMKIMGGQFVFARDIDEALARQGRQPENRRLYSFDMLGEGARTAAQAERYAQAYGGAIQTLGESLPAPLADPARASSISIKLSALHPRYEARQRNRVMHELLPRLSALAQQAASFNLQLTIDAEEADRLDLSLQVFAALCRDPALAGWNGLGLAVQAYQKRALAVIEFLAGLAAETRRLIPVRLVKGAYWDTEIKHSQVMGHDDFPVFTRKAATDVSYLVCAQRLFAHGGALYPQFATHNAHSLAAIVHLGQDRPYELQRLHGMGELLYAAAAKTLLPPGIPVRTYAPVGAHRDLLPYLVRRLLENGANSSFVNRFMDARVPVEEVVADPISLLEAEPAARGPGIVRPAEIFGARRNSAGLDLNSRSTSDALLKTLAARRDQPVAASAIVDGSAAGGEARPVRTPADPGHIVGQVREARPEDGLAALSSAQAAQTSWDGRGGAARADILEAMGDALERERETLIHLLCREAGRTLDDAIDEIREAVDFCRDYAAQARLLFGPPQHLPGPTGEDNRLSLHGRGVFLCISPWNFPLAIFTGQIAAALAAGNSVLAKPAEQTPLIAHAAVRLWQAAGLPAEVLHLLPGDGPGVAGPLLADARIAGVAFTGSTATARLINQQLAAREGPIAALIAETGGQNAMVVDSTALLEQVTDDVMRSAFSSAGQRCSALRVLLVQDVIAEDLIGMLAGALAERRIGDPAQLDTDIGPVIDIEARHVLDAHCQRMDREARLLACAALTDRPEGASFFAPRMYEIHDLSQLSGEVFGPVLHVLRYAPADLDRHIQALNNTGYGLTFGVHSRLSGRADALFAASRAGNVYVNRNIIGAVVGSQPFGGAGLSGTGPKAGGPHYLPRFAIERVRSTNTAAIGGNTDLFRLQ